jgi:hypothetical protein
MTDLVPELPYWIVPPPEFNVGWRRHQHDRIILNTDAELNSQIIRLLRALDNKRFCYEKRLKHWCWLHNDDDWRTHKQDVARWVYENEDGEYHDQMHSSRLEYRLKLQEALHGSRDQKIRLLQWLEKKTVLNIKWTLLKDTKFVEDPPYRRRYRMTPMQRQSMLNEAKRLAANLKDIERQIEEIRQGSEFVRFFAQDELKELRKQRQELRDILLRFGLTLHTP